MPHDIDFRHFPTLDWSDKQREGSIACLIGYASEETQQVIGWYLRKKQSKRVGARSLRLLAVLATSAGAIVPLVAQIYPGAVQPGWATIALVLAVAAIGLDRFFGYSSAWMRYLATEMQIRQSLHSFLMTVEAKRAALTGSPPELADVDYFLTLCRDFLLKLHETVRDETAVWSSELRSVLREMEDAARVHAHDRRQEEIKLAATDGEQAPNRLDGYRGRGEAQRASRGAA